MKKTILICDACGEECTENYTPSATIGAFSGKVELLIVPWIRKCGSLGVASWEEVDLCVKCKSTALRMISEWWIRATIPFEFRISINQDGSKNENPLQR